MLRSTSNFIGLNCQTAPYSFSGRKPVDAKAYRKSAHAISPGKSGWFGTKNSALSTLKTRLSTANVGWIPSCTAGCDSGMGVSVAIEIPFVLSLTFGA